MADECLFFLESRTCHSVEICSLKACLIKNSADDTLKYFSYFSQKTGFDISCQLSPQETIGMKCQSLFSGEKYKNISICHLLKILPSVLSVMAVIMKYKVLLFWYKLEKEDNSKCYLLIVI